MKAAAVLDLGSDTIKAGFSSSQCPQYILPNILSRPSDSKSRFLCCDKAISYEYDSNISYPLQKTNVSNWEDQCHILDYVFNSKLKINPKEYKLMITESPLVNRKQRRKLIEIFFEEYSIPSLYIIPESLSALCGADLTSGTIIEIGQNATRVVSIIDHKIVPKSCAHIKVGGADITYRLMKLLQLRKFKLPDVEDPSDLQTKVFINEFKENHCHVSKNIVRQRSLYDTNSVQFSTYTAKNGSTIKLHGEIYEPAEVLFDPSLVGMEGPGLIPTLFTNIARITDDNTLRSQITKNVILSGGTALMNGLPERVTLDIKQLIKSEIAGQNKYNLNENLIPEVESFPHSNVLVYAGAAITAHNYLPHDEYWSSLADYHNDGSDSIVRRFKTSTLRQ